MMDNHCRALLIRQRGIKLRRRYCGQQSPLSQRFCGFFRKIVLREWNQIPQWYGGGLAS